ncbi:hypothetical protein KKH82_01685 [Patescibacteria group bacterium]|nr:hypothetical protein [Patescibacteria group bacterium]
MIGKLGIFGDYTDIKIAQKLIQQEAEKYKLSDNQKNIKKFHFPFKYWVKETTLWKYYLT